MDTNTTKLTTQSRQITTDLNKARDAADRFFSQSRADSTWRAYRSDWRIFIDWCASIDRPALPADPETLVLFLASQADLGLNPSTLTRRLAAIRLVHIGNEYPNPGADPSVTELMRGIRRSWKKPPAAKAPILNTTLKEIVDQIPTDTKAGLRDRAVLLFGFAGSFRRSELVALDVDDLELQSEGYLIRITSSKTDQLGQGQVIAIPKEENSPYCPVAALQAWCDAGEIDSGPLFRRMFRGDSVGSQRLTDQSVALIIKKWAGAFGLSSEQFAGHSLRRGFVTSAAKEKKNLFKIADQTRHASIDMLRKYYDDQDRFDDHAGTGLLQSKQQTHPTNAD